MLKSSLAHIHCHSIIFDALYIFVGHIGFKSLNVLSKKRPNVVHGFLVVGMASDEIKMKISQSIKSSDSLEVSGRPGLN